MEWPPQNTGLFAPPACASCCAGTPPPAEFARYTSLFTINGVVQSEAYKLMIAPDYTLTITQQARDPVTGIVAVGVMDWYPETYGDLAGTPLECQGCYGYSCIDGDGNPIGGTWGYNGNGPDHQHWEFYYVSSAEHGTAEDVWYNGFTKQPYDTNMPTCESFGGVLEDVHINLEW